MLNFLDRFGRSIFPDAPIFRQRVVDALDSMSSISEQRQFVEQLLSLTETRSSLVLKANVALLLYEWLCSREGETWQANDDWHEASERILPLIACVLQGSVSDDAPQAVLAALETVTCRWLYHIWASSIPSGDSRLYELSYLARVGASHIVDVLAVDGQISQEMTQRIVERLILDLKFRLLVSGAEPQPDGFFCPAWSVHLNYAASYLLNALSSDDLPSPEFGSVSIIRAAALLGGARHRLEQTLCSSSDPSWLDANLATDIGTASLAILGQPSETEFEIWSEKERNYLLLTLSPEAATSSAEEMIATLSKIDGQEQVMEQVFWLFRDRIYPSAAWFELLHHFFAPEVLNTLRRFEMCYGEVMLRLGDMLLHLAQNCPPELMTSISTLLFEVPVGENAAALIEVKAGVLSRLLDFGLDVELVCQWLEEVARNEAVDVPVVRSALRPFILLWPQYSKKVREPLFDALMRIARLSDYGGLWEFVRLARHQCALSTDEISSDLESSL